MDNKIYVIMGPTGIGKTKLLFEVLKDTNQFEVISVDSRQIYKYMPIGTAAPETYIQQAIPHHLVEFIEPNQSFSAGQFVKMAEACLLDIQTRNKIPILCGGTGFYLKAFYTGMFYEEDLIPLEKKREIEEYLQSLTKEERLQRLKKIDPQSIDTIITGKGIIHPNDEYRIFRSLELYYTTGKTLRMHYCDFHETIKWNIEGIFIVPDIPQWEKNLQIRAENMIQQGFIQEAIEIFKSYNECPALKTPGYRETYDLYKQYKDKILYDDSLKKEIKDILYRTHKQYGKAQIKWFKKDRVLKHVAMDQAYEFLQNILKLFSI